MAPFSAPPLELRARNLSLGSFVEFVGLHGKEAALLTGGRGKVNGWQNDTARLSITVVNPTSQRGHIWLLRAANLVAAPQTRGSPSLALRDAPRGTANDSANGAPSLAAARRPPPPPQVVRPPPEVLPLNETEREQCSEVIQQWWSPHAGTGEPPAAILLTYATDPTRHWMLGLSAAMHGLPLVLVGRGRQWGGFQAKYLGVRRAAEALAQLHLHHETGVLFADGDDSVVANTPTARVAERMRHITRSPGTLLAAGECNSYPICYLPHYAQHASYWECRERSAACYPNSGAYFASAPTLVRLLPSLIAYAQHNLTGAQRGDDQAALHHLYLTPAAFGGTRSRLEIDGDARLFGSLFPCKGDNRSRWERGIGRPCKGQPGEPEPYDALEHLNASADGHAIAMVGSSAVEFPVVLHANGKTHRTKLDPAFEPLRRALGLATRGLGAVGGAPADRLLRHLLLLVDDAGAPACRVASLGSVLEGASSSNSFRDLGR